MHRLGLIIGFCSFYIQLKQEFCTVLNLESKATTLMANWDMWMRRIVGYARVEVTNRKKLQDYLDDFDASDKGRKMSHGFVEFCYVIPYFSFQIPTSRVYSHYRSSVKYLF